MTDLGDGPGVGTMAQLSNERRGMLVPADRLLVYATYASAAGSG
jgi:hypothetical protein